MVDTLTRAKRKSTALIIEKEGRDIQLHRPGKSVLDGAGGRKPSGPGTTLPPKRRYFALIHEVSRVALRESVATEATGSELMPTHVLIGPWDDDIRVGDWFWADGVKFYVHDVERDLLHKEWEFKAKCGTRVPLFVRGQ